MMNYPVIAIVNISTFKDINEGVSLIKKSVNNLFKKVNYSTAFHNIARDNSEDNVILYIKSNGDKWLGRWSNHTWINSECYNVNKEATSILEFIEKIKQYKNNNNENRLQEQEVHNRTRGERRGTSIKVRRSYPTITIGQISYKAINY